MSCGFQWFSLTVSLLFGALVEVTVKMVAMSLTSSNPAPHVKPLAIHIPRHDASPVYPPITNDSIPLDTDYHGEPPSSHPPLPTHQPSPHSLTHNPHTFHPPLRRHPPPSRTPRPPTASSHPPCPRTPPCPPHPPYPPYPPRHRYRYRYPPSHPPPHPPPPADTSGPRAPGSARAGSRRARGA